MKDPVIDIEADWAAKVERLEAHIIRLSVENKMWVARFNVVKDRCDPECVHCAAWRGG